jgi:hypothetical protein
MMKVLEATLLVGSLVLLASGSAFAEISCDTDFNGDGATNETDLEILKNYMGATEDDEGYTPVVDLNDDGRVDMADLNAFLSCN